MDQIRLGSKECWFELSREVAAVYLLQAPIDLGSSFLILSLSCRLASNHFPRNF
ncbi:hypothetical protein DPMN_165865 [Dreissena polymorpha]|uniref:Uncharacterized protein n=1 Tax=Dreissena polymorpha TaxID=45954 RepID=A0A9D4EWZ4_DREPO|nr:hypothetical protein DPMN_165865 [Dreissena polymorpha]